MKMYTYKYLNDMNIQLICKSNMLIVLNDSLN
jgi:hypothetical protein